MSTSKPPENTTPCFGQLDIVFPEGGDGLRESPEACLACQRKTACLQAAMAGQAGLKVKEASLDRAYAAGLVGFFERWSKKKQFQQQIRDHNKKKAQ